MTVMGPSAARAFPTTARMADGSPALAGNAAASMPFAFSAFTPASSVSWFRATRATEKPDEPNFSATDVEMPGPNPTTRSVFPTRRFDDEPMRPLLFLGYWILGAGGTGRGND